MNIVLFEPNELSAPLKPDDPRTVHILKVLRRKCGDSFDAGLIDGPRGKATLQTIDPAGITLSFSWGDPPPPLPPIKLLVGMPRPQTARKILQEATALGVADFQFALTARSEPSYADSSLWSSGEWGRHLREGAAQAFCTRIPRLSHGSTLAACVEQLAPGGSRIALDNYESAVDLAGALAGRIGAVGVATPVILAVGSERGWAEEERLLLKQHGFVLAHLGARVLRTETAVVAALAIVNSTLHWP